MPNLHAYTIDAIAPIEHPIDTIVPLYGWKKKFNKISWKNTVTKTTKQEGISCLSFTKKISQRENKLFYKCQNTHTHTLSLSLSLSLSLFLSLSLPPSLSLSLSLVLEPACVAYEEEVWHDWNEEEVV